MYLDTTMEELLEIPEAVAIIEKHLPGLTTHPYIDRAFAFTLRVISSMPQASVVGLTPEVYKLIEEDFAKLSAQ